MASLKALNVWLISTENQTFIISFTLLQVGTAWAKDLAIMPSLPHVDVRKSIF